jgi:uncharacterized protein YndB with AHSA1/START domain
MSHDLKFVYVTHIRTTPATLWRALIDPRFIEQYWMGRHNTSGWRKGSPLESRAPDGELEWKGKIVEIKKPRRLVYTFQPVDAGEPPSRVTFEIKTPGRGTDPRGETLQLTVTHEEFPAGSIVFPGISQGWPAILSSLKTLLETGRSLGLVFEE